MNFGFNFVFNDFKFFTSKLKLISSQIFKKQYTGDNPTYTLFFLKYFFNDKDESLKRAICAL